MSNLREKADNPDMRLRRTFPRLAIVLTIALGTVSLWAAKAFVMPRPENANTYASKDAHPMENVTAAIELYNSPPKSDIFVTPYAEEALLPVYLVITNEGDRPIALTSMRAQLVTSNRSKLEALTTDDVFRRVGHVSASSTNPSSGRVGPLPLPGGNKNKKAQKSYEEILAANFAAEAVEPHTTKAGFLFFDIANVKQPAQGSHIYLTGITDGKGSELMYFDIPVIASNAADNSGH